LFDSKSKSRVRFDSFPSDVTSDDDVIDAVSADTGFPLSVKISNLHFLSAALAQMPLLAFKCRLPCFELNKSAPGRAKAMFDKMFPMINRSWLECTSRSARGREYSDELFHAVFHAQMVEKFRLSASQSTAYNIVGELLQGNLIEDIIGRESISVTDLLRGFKILDDSDSSNDSSLPIPRPSDWKFIKPKVKVGIESENYFQATFCGFHSKQNQMFIFIAEGDRVSHLYES